MILTSVKATDRKPTPQKIVFALIEVDGKKLKRLAYTYSDGTFACSDEGEFVCIFRDDTKIEWFEETK